jgi:hypothetical protein
MNEVLNFLMYVVTFVLGVKSSITFTDYFPEPPQALQCSVICIFEVLRNLGWFGRVSQ